MLYDWFWIVDLRVAAQWVKGHFQRSWQEISQALQLTLLIDMQGEGIDQASAYAVAFSSQTPRMNYSSLESGPVAVVKEEKELNWFITTHVCFQFYQPIQLVPAPSDIM